MPDVRRAFALGSASFYGDPANELTMIGVTGTNGKTTTTHILRSVLEADGRRTGLIGTNGARLGDKIYETSLTTPDPPALHRLLAQMLEDGADTVVMEVSAHALALGKVDAYVSPWALSPI